MTIACVDFGAAGERLAMGDPGWLAPTVIGAAALGLSLLIPAVSAAAPGSPRAMPAAAGRRSPSRAARPYARPAASLPPASCVMQPILPVATSSGAGLRDVGELAVAQAAGDLRLQQVVGAGRAAAEMPLGHLDRANPAAASSALRLGCEGAGRAAASRPSDRRRAARAPRGRRGGRRPSAATISRHVPGERGDARRLFGIGRVLAQHEAVILDGGAAARGVDRRSRRARRRALALPGVDIGAGEGERRRLLPEMVDERRRSSRSPAATTTSQPCRVSSRIVASLICGRQHLLGAAGQQRDPHSPLALGREDLRPVDRRGARDRGAAPAPASARSRAGSSARTGRASARRHQRQRGTAAGRAAPRRAVGAAAARPAGGGSVCSMWRRPDRRDACN